MSVREISEAEFESTLVDPDDIVLLEFNEETGAIQEDGWIDIDQEDRELIGEDFLNALIHSNKERIYGLADNGTTYYVFERI